MLDDPTIQNLKVSFQLKQPSRGSFAVRLEEVESDAQIIPFVAQIDQRTVGQFKILCHVFQRFPLSI